MPVDLADISKSSAPSPQSSARHQFGITGLAVALYLLVLAATLASFGTRVILSTFAPHHSFGDYNPIEPARLSAR